MLNISKNLRNFYFNGQNGKPEERSLKNNFKVSDAFTKSDTPKTLSFGAVLKPAEQKQFIEIMKKNDKETERLLSFMTSLQKKVAELRYPVKGRRLFLREIAEELSLTKNNVNGILRRIGENFQIFL